MARRPEFEEVKEAVLREVVSVSTDYGLIRQFFWPLLRQQELLDNYPLLIGHLYRAVTGNIIMALSRLFEDDDDARRASLQTFPCHLKAGAGLTKPGIAAEKRESYLAQVDSHIGEIAEANKRLAVQRSAYWAHADLTKRRRDDPIKWSEVEGFVELAQKVLKGYFSAYEGVYQRLEIVDLEWEPKSFFKWARLDDYAAHRAKEREARRAAIEDWARRRREGDPTVPDRPPI